MGLKLLPQIKPVAARSILICICFLLAATNLTFGESSLHLPVQEILGTEYYVYEVKKGESIYGIAKKNNWNLEELLNLNPEAKSNLYKGLKLYYPVDQSYSSIEMTQTKTISHTVKKGENIYSISRLYGIPLETIYKDNPASRKGVKPGDTLNISLDEYEIEENGATINESNNENAELAERTINFSDIYPIQEQPDTLTEEIAKTPLEDEIKIALILDDPDSKKDIDFTRGYLVALFDLKDFPIKINLKILDGRISSTNIISDLDEFDPTLIISTADKAFPLFLADYGNTNNKNIVNVFDLKNNLYEDNMSIIQILPPSSYYSGKIANQLYYDNKRRKLIAVGTLDENDEIGTELINLFGDNIEILSLEEFGAYEPDLMDSILIYSFASKKEDVGDFLNNVENLAVNNPGLDFNIVGRSSWIAMVDDYGDKFKDYFIMVPSRVRLEEDSKEWKEFTDTYGELFDGYPVRSIPNFAATGYDIAKYFISAFIDNDEDFGKRFFTPEENMLQNDFTFNRINDTGGLINGTSYIIRFLPNGESEKIIVN